MDTGPVLYDILGTRGWKGRTVNNGLERARLEKNEINLRPSLWDFIDK